MTPNLTLYFIIAITALVSVYGFKNFAFFDRYSFNINAILKHRQYERLITSAFLHSNFSHLFFNLFSLYFLGKSFANGSFLLIYFFSILGGSLLSLFFHRKEAYYRAIGASGGVSGIIYAAIALNPHLKLIIFPIPFAIEGWIFAIFYLFYCIFGMQTRQGNIGHSAHLGGSLAGLLILFVLAPGLLLENKIYIGLMSIPLLYLALKELKFIK